MNGNKKYDVTSIYCEQGKCILKPIETTDHFVLKCPQYFHLRTQFLYQINSIYSKFYSKQSFMQLSIQEKLKHLLYPFETLIYQFKCQSNITLFQQIWTERILCLKLFIQFIIDTKRFQEFI